jgi:REP element-mobilizing transposase RayT
MFAVGRESETHPAFKAENIDKLRDVFKAARRRRPFTIEGSVILPDHLCCIWTLPFGDADLFPRWLFKFHRYMERAFITVNGLQMIMFEV